MKGGSRNRKFGGVLFVFGFLFHAGFLALGIPPLVLAINSYYTVDNKAYPVDGTFVSLSRNKGLLFECLLNPADVSLVTSQTCEVSHS
ncbi:hypothetical protein Ciccas_005827 [Cichlidogyrus casuarinus]|uniref:Uncharacterized protein n=1 Tax=Cichlidogyrus casuarinus TaxID=1844966 RepID=A0ABD2Q7K3_9PLAT